MIHALEEAKRRHSKPIDPAVLSEDPQNWTDAALLTLLLPALSAPKAEAMEPIAWVFEWKPSTNNNPWQMDVALHDPRINAVRSYRNVLPLYTSPVPALTDEAVERAVDAIEGELDGVFATKEQARAILEYAILGVFPDKGERL